VRYDISYTFSIIELGSLGMEDIWINGEENIRNILREVSKRRMDIERQNMEASMRERRSLVFYNELKSSWGQEIIHRSMYPRG
jgi:hypothetical protein